MAIRHITEGNLYMINFKLTEESLVADYPIHWHDHYEIEYIVSGQAEIYVNNVCITAKPNTLFLFTPTDFEEIKLLTPSFQIVKISISPSVIDSDINKKITSCCVIEHFNPSLINLLKSEHMIKNESHDFICKNLINCIFAKIAYQRPIVINSDNKTQPIISAEQYIKHHFLEKITLTEVANYVGFSTNYLSNLFHKELGKTFTEYLTDLRLTHAFFLIKNTDIPISSVCAQSGFNNYSNFFKLFKTKYIKSPDEYRKRFNIKK